MASLTKWSVIWNTKHEKWQIAKNKYNKCTKHIWKNTVIYGDCIKKYQYFLTHKFVSSKIYAQVHLEKYAVMVNFMCQLG